MFKNKKEKAKSIDATKVMDRPAAAGRFTANLERRGGDVEEAFDKLAAIKLKVTERDIILNTNWHERFAGSPGQ